MANTKVIITGASNIDKLKYAKEIISKDDYLSIGYTFISDEQYKIENDLYLYYLNVNEINLSYKNNALLYVYNVNNEYTSKGITLDNFYNSDITFMNINEFNMICDNVFHHNDILVIWLDTIHNVSNSNIKNDMLETQYLIDKLNCINYMYFLDEDESIVAEKVIKYLNGTEEERKELLCENS